MGGLPLIQVLGPNMLQRILVGLNAALAIGLGAFVWVMLPFAVGVRCEAMQQVCPPMLSWSRAAFAASPALTIFVLCWLGLALLRRSKGVGYVFLFLAPLAVALWAALVWFTTLP